MILTKFEKEFSTKWVESIPKGPKGEPFPLAIQKRILNSAVRLSGGSLNGSGVIFNVKLNSVSIVSAAHNAMVLAGVETPPQNWADLLAGQNGFKNKVKIFYGDGNATFNSLANKSAPITTVTVPKLDEACGQRANCLYDLMVITSTDVNLQKYAIEKVFGGTWSADANKLRAAVETINKAIKAEAAVVKDSPNALLSRKKYYFVQLGFGDTEDDKRKNQWLSDGKIAQSDVATVKCENAANVIAQRLQYRWTYPHSSQVASLYEQSAAPNEDPAYSESCCAISIGGSKSSSSAPGDSGGPLYAIDKQYNGVYLIGVNCGADMKPSKKISHPFSNCVATSVAPYWKNKFDTEFP